MYFIKQGGDFVAIVYTCDRFTFDKDDIAELFESVHWECDLTDKVAFTGLLKSSHLILAFDGNKLIGLIRSMDDDIYCANIDLLIVHKDYQRNGIGTELIKRMRDNLTHVKYINVMPTDPMNVSLYQKCGFVLTKGKLLQIVNF